MHIKRDVIRQYIKYIHMCFFRESLKAALTIPSMYPAIDTLEALVNSDLEWGVRSFGGWPDWFKDSKVRK